MSDLMSLIALLVFTGIIIVFWVIERNRRQRNLRSIAAFSSLRNGVGKAVEAGKRLHLSLGHGSIHQEEVASALVGLSVLGRVARAASISDLPPIATSGEATYAVLSQDTLRAAYRAVGAENQYDPDYGMLSGVTPFSFAAGTLPVIYDENVSFNILLGHFGSEIGLILDAAERNGSEIMGGSNDLVAQSVLYATTEEPLIGEELFASGAYINAGPMHLASLRAQDFARWVIVSLVILGSILKVLNLL